MLPTLHPAFQTMWFLPAAALLAGVATGQDRRPVPDREPLPEPAREIVAGGEVRLVPIESREDSVPLPVPARYAEGPGGDVLLAPASGDPFFLGFAAGDYRPPVGEQVDPLLAEQALLVPADRESGDTYAFVMFSKRMTRERLEALEAQGARILGRHPFYALKVALPGSSVEAVAALDFVRWVGLARQWQKVHPALAARVAGAAAEELVDVYVNLFESDLNPGSTFEYVGNGLAIGPGADPATPLAPEWLVKRWMSNGWQQRALEDAGLQVRAYLDGITAFQARLRVADLARVRDLDFVQFVELDLPMVLMHDESTPMIGADLTRVTDDGGTFGEAIVGVADTGIENSHGGLNHIYGWGWDLAGTTGPWDDVHGHGSHVSGTFFGDAPSPNQALTGVAPGLGASLARLIFNVKIFDDNGNWFGGPIQDIFDLFHTDLSFAPKPHVTNNSWGAAPSSPWIGSEANARTVDLEVYAYRQLHVFAAGNTGPGAGTTWLPGVAKNAFTVGNVVPYATSSGPPGMVAWNSSRGPCGDGRWKPNICAPGTGIESVNSSTTNGYTIKSGTSMAAPHVAGVAAQLADQWSFLRTNPQTLGAVMMATAMSKDNQLLTYPTDQHLDEYGTGRVESYKALNPDSQQALFFWGFVSSSVNTAELDFSVGTGATQLTVVMLYHDIPASSGASQALVQDVDMRLDREPFTGSGNSGDYFYQVSHIDNAEVRILSNPADGNWKVKCYPESVGAWFAPWVGVCVVVTYGDTTPDGAFSLTADKAYAKPNETVQFDASVWNPSYVGSAVFLDSTASGGLSLSQSEVILADGSLADLLDNPAQGRDVLLGDIVHGKSRAVEWRGSWGTEGVKSFCVDLVSDNMDPETKCVQVVVDGTPPTTVSGLQSTTHTLGEHSCDIVATMTWNSATDALAGLAGYSIVWSNDPNTVPNTTLDLGAGATSYTAALPPSTLPWYFHIRALDKAGNAGATVYRGPYYINVAQVTNYCNSNLNSTGKMASLSVFDTICLAEGQLTLHTVDLPPNQFGYYLFSSNKGNVPFFGGSQGVLCLSGPIIRFDKFPLSSGSGGVITFSPDLSNLPQNQVFQHGSTWNFQLWFRDKNPGQTSNTSNGIEIVWD